MGRETTAPPLKLPLHLRHLLRLPHSIGSIAVTAILTLTIVIWLFAEPLMPPVDAFSLPIAS